MLDKAETNSAFNLKEWDFINKTYTQVWLKKFQLQRALKSLIFVLVNQWVPF